MDVGGRDKVETEKRSEYSVNYNTSRVPSDWQSSGANFVNSSMGMVCDGNPIAFCKGDMVNSPSYLSSMLDSFGPTFWEHPANLQPSEFNSISANSAASTLDKLGQTRGPGSLMVGLEAGWGAPDAMLKGGILLPTGPGVIPHSFPQFSADSAFIERAARFSCFSTGNIADMVNPFGMNRPGNPYHQVAMMPQDRHQVSGGNSVRVVSSGEPRKNEVNLPSTSKDTSLSAEQRGQEWSPRKPEKKNSGVDSDAKQAGSDQVCTAGGDGQEEPSSMDSGSEPSSAKGLGSKKRKRDGQDTELEQSQQQSGEDEEDNGNQNSPAPSNKGTGKIGKQSSQTSDPPKEEYIHVRARRGQATNSHSLAERVRREKISERMKFLQDLVPGCSKVTGKAVMLDEIINYVQSLQRQVEFLSMKLATVNPRFDCNVGSLLAKDQMFAARAGPPPLGFFPDMPLVYPPLHPSQSTVIQPGLPVIGSTSEALRNINTQLTGFNEGYREPNPQMHNLWDDGPHNVVQMGFNPDASNQDTRSLSPGHMKAER